MASKPHNGQHASQCSIRFTMFDVFWNVKYVSHCSIYFTMFHITQCLTMFNIIHYGKHTSQWLFEFSLRSSAHAPRKNSQEHPWQPLPSPPIFLFLFDLVLLSSTFSKSKEESTALSAVLLFTKGDDLNGTR